MLQFQRFVRDFCESPRGSAIIGVLVDIRWRGAGLACDITPILRIMTRREDVRARFYSSAHGSRLAVALNHALASRPKQWLTLLGHDVRVSVGSIANVIEIVFYHPMLVDWMSSEEVCWGYVWEHLGFHKHYMKYISFSASNRLAFGYLPIQKLNKST